MTIFAYKHLIAGLANAGVQALDPDIHARSLAARKISVGPISQNGDDFLATPSDNLNVVNATANEFPNANWGLKTGPEAGIIALQFENGASAEHEFGALGNTWTTVSSHGRVVRLFRIPTISAVPIGELAGVCRVLTIAPLPGSILPGGEQFFWATGYAPGQLSLANCNADLLYALPKMTTSISARRQKYKKMRSRPELGGDEKHARLAKR